MKKKYQVFVSSTYEDLKDERAAVMQCLLDNDCIPVGMEQFPASEMSQMDYIKKMLDDCDYYVLISAGRYGSLDTDGIGFTEKEYDYAISKSIPVMSVLFKNVDMLPSGKCERTDQGKEKLEEFRKKISTGRMVNYYTDIGTLKYAVSNAINHCIRNYPAVGWVRGDSLDKKESAYPTDDQDGLKLLAQKAKSADTSSKLDTIINKIDSIGSKIDSEKVGMMKVPNEAGGNTVYIDTVTNLKKIGNYSITLIDGKNTNGWEKHIEEKLSEI